jgi:hypothetical protein
MTGNRTKGGEQETERERIGKRDRETDRERQWQWREKTAWVIREDGVGRFDHWSKSTPGYFWRRQSIEQ